MPNRTLIIVYSIVLVILLILSFIFSSADMAFGSVPLARLENELKEKPNKKSVKNAIKLVNNYDKTISTILLLNDTVNAGLDTISTLLGVAICVEIVGGESASSETWGLVASLICLILKIIIGEIFAKSFGKIKNYELSKNYSLSFNILNYAFLPITFFVAKFGTLVSYPIVHNNKDLVITDEELHEMVDEFEDSGSVDEEKAELLHDAIDFAETEAYEIMTPRVDVYAVEVNDSIEEIMKDERTLIYSRIPVYEDSIDNIVGYVTSNELIQVTIDKSDVTLKDLMIKPLVFPRSTEINDIFMKFKSLHQHIAIVQDEYGGVDGIITLEDILEELVGEIWDEQDDPEMPYVKNKNGTYIVDGMMNLMDFCELFDIDYEEIDTEYVTIGGYCVELLGNSFARLNQIIEYENLTMKVIAIDEKSTIEKLLIRVRK